MYSTVDLGAANVSIFYLNRQPFGRNALRQRCDSGPVTPSGVLSVAILRPECTLFRKFALPISLILCIMSEAPDKDHKIFYSIREVAAMFDVNESLLRFWEKEFPQIKPKKGSRGIRSYTKDDIAQIRLIYDLVKGRGLKIAAARDVLKKNKEGAPQPLEALQRLRAVRAELVAMRDALGCME